jgi:hypothetical protein
MHHAQGLCDSDLSLVLGQSVQSLEYSLDLALSQQFLCELLYGTLSNERLIYDGVLTESSLSNLFRGQSKH